MSWSTELKCPGVGVLPLDLAVLTARVGRSGGGNRAPAADVAGVHEIGAGAAKH